MHHPVDDLDEFEHVNQNGPAPRQMDSERELVAMARTYLDDTYPMRVGAWHHDGITEWELASYYPDRDVALTAARMGGQHSIWDNANSAEIPTGV